MKNGKRKTKEILCIAEGFYLCNRLLTDRFGSNIAPMDNHGQKQGISQTHQFFSKNVIQIYEEKRKSLQLFYVYR